MAEEAVGKTRGPRGQAQLTFHPAGAAAWRRALRNVAGRPWHLLLGRAAAASLILASWVSWENTSPPYLQSVCMALLNSGSPSPRKNWLAGLRAPEGQFHLHDPLSSNTWASAGPQILWTQSSIYALLIICVLDANAFSWLLLTDLPRNGCSCDLPAL